MTSQFSILTLYHPQNKIMDVQTDKEGADAYGVGGARKLTDVQRERIARNREKAKSLRQARIAAKPYDRRSDWDTRTHSPAKGTTLSTTTSTPSNLKPRRFDSHGGYILEEEEKREIHNYRYVEDEAPAMPDEQMVCEECRKRFAESFLHTKFQLSVCDQCRDQDGKHSLITKTEARQKFLLKDCDFEERNGPPLPYLLKRNPHSSSWGDMRLYLKCQVRKRSYDIWEGEDGLEAEHQRRSAAREKRKEQKYAKEIKELRRAVRSSMLQTLSAPHEHIFPPGREVHDAESDTWTKTCTDCGYQVTFEKM